MTEITASGDSFDATVAMLTDELGFAMTMLTPADDPSLVVLSRDGIELTVRRDAGIDLSSRVMELPDLAPELVICPIGDDDIQAWGIGRAGMRYRDLIPSRLGGRFIASHIEVCDGGPVPDRVHHHAVRFQLIFCQRGWVDVVYEDQGEPFRMHAGDCVTQPPHIRHKVLASSAGARVVEIGCPAEHDTLFDDQLELPTATVDRDRRWDGQRFVRHVGADAPWIRSRYDALEAQVTDIAAATDGLADVRVLRPAVTAGRTITVADPGHDGEFHFLFALSGTAELAIDGQTLQIVEGDAITVPAAMPWTMTCDDPELRLLEIRLPG